MLTSGGRALKIESPGLLTISPVKLRPLREHEVLVSVRYVGICGSDVKLFSGRYEGPHVYPLVPGHEWVGEIIAKGAGVQKFSVGERVTGECSIYCGQCQFCREINEDLCTSVKKHGISANGFAADYVIVNQSSLHSLKDCEMSDVIACLIEPAAVVMKGIDKATAHMDPHDVLILGAGTLGILATMIIKSKPNAKVMIVDINETRLQIARELGADQVVAMDMKLMPAHVGRGSFDLVVETSGFSDVGEVINHTVKPGGSVLFFSQPKVSFSTDLFVSKMVNIFGNIGGTGKFREAIELLDSKGSEIVRLITNVIELGEFPQIYSQDESVVTRGCKTILKVK